MFCTHCGTKLDDSARYCTACGRPTALAATGAIAGAVPYYAEPRRLRRLMTEKKIAGVCAGFAEYFETDVTLMRIIWLVLALFTGVGFIAYLVAMMVLPKSYDPPLYATEPR